MATKSKNEEQITFRSAVKNTQELCGQHPEIFDHARVALQEWDQGKYTLVGAVVAGMVRAHEAGLKGKKLPPLTMAEVKELSAVREVPTPGARAAATGYKTEDLISPPRTARTLPRPAPEPEPAAPVRVGRSRPVVAPVVAKRFSRS